MQEKSHPKTKMFKKGTKTHLLGIYSIYLTSQCNHNIAYRSKLHTGCQNKKNFLGVNVARKYKVLPKGFIGA
jgi:hypothetical protein